MINACELIFLALQIFNTIITNAYVYIYDTIDDMISIQIKNIEIDLIHNEILNS